MILFTFETYSAMAAAVEKACGAARGQFRVSRFENGELYVAVHSPVRDENCLILGSVAPPDQQLLSTLLLAHTLKKEGARKTIAVLPYLAYARHDKDKPGESLGTGWLGAIAQASAIDCIVTVDIHSERARNLFPIPVRSLSPAEIFAEALRRFGLLQATLVAPDAGAIGRCEAVQRAAAMPAGKIPYFEKRRGPALGR
jgi:ribose-phosphate pyrophosphokinase